MVPDHPRARQALLSLAGFASAAVVVMLLVGFMWPHDARQDLLNLGPVDELPVGHARLFTDAVDFLDFRWDVPTLFEEAGSPNNRSHEVTIAIVRCTEPGGW